MGTGNKKQSQQGTLAGVAGDQFHDYVQGSRPMHISGVPFQLFLVSRGGGMSLNVPGQGL